MKVLLIGNYPYLRSQSMDRFAAVLLDGLKDAGYQVRLLKPKPYLGRVFPSATGFGKWLGYIDRFLLFRTLLNQAADWADVVHICDQSNAVYAPWLKNKPHVVTCHDMIAIQSSLSKFTEHTTKITGKAYQRWILSGLKQACHVACVSKTTHGDVMSLTVLEPERISIVQNGLNFPYRPMKQSDSLPHLEQLGISNCQPFFLHVGGNYWYKNKKGLLRIFQKIPPLKENQQTKLVLAGQKLPYNLQLIAKDIGIFDRIWMLSNVSNEQLCALYSSAEGLIFPSFAEGFGWPIIEAQACGCPVFTSGRAPMTEIGGSAAVYFDPLDELDSARIIWQAIQSKNYLRERGFRNAMKFSTMDMISGYVDCYRKVTL